jgi:glyoxylase-like metal-dependent hydrolase (beta-lactamase superfamily II)
VDYVILTHIHLDHAGGAGVMMEAFPNAKLVVHPRGARHMIEPTKLMAGVEGVYGQERARKMYGKPDPDCRRTHHRGPRQHRAQARLARTAVHRRAGPCETPHRHRRPAVERHLHRRHLRHFLPRTRCRRPAADLPSSTPIQFDPDEMRASIERMLSFNPDAVYLTHFSRLAPPAELGRTVLRCSTSYVDHRARGQRG